MAPSSDEKAQAILQAATTLLANEGYANTTIRQIAEAAGVSRGLLHYYFKNKEDILARVVRATAERTTRLVTLLFEKSSTAEELATNLVSAIRYIDQTSPDLFNILFESWAVARQSPLVAQELQRVFQHFRTALLEGLVSAAARGVVQTHLPPLGLATLLTGIIDGLALQVITEPAIKDKEALWQAITTAVQSILLM
jgi:AcrR family transcriptional regulator